VEQGRGGVQALSGWCMAEPYIGEGEKGERSATGFNPGGGGRVQAGGKGLKMFKFLLC